MRKESLIQDVRGERMKEFFKDALKLPYKPNNEVREHENQIEDLLKKHGLKYKPQPNGPQQSPDFHVNHNGKVISLECKSSKDPKPIYNGGLPKKGVVYIFSSKKYNETTLYFAEDVVSDKKRELYDEYLMETNQILKKYQALDEWKNDDRGFHFYNRSMYTQKGNAEKTDYFKHENRKRCEQRVLNYKW